MIASFLKPTLLSIFAAFALALTSTSQAILDTNANSMSDVWESQHNANQLFTPTNPNHDSTADPDQDGWSNAQESLAGTNPFDGSIPTGKTTLRITAAAQSSTYELTWPIILGKTYRLQASTNLTTWTTIGQIITPEPTATEHTVGVEAQDPNATATAAAPRLFWRISITDQDSDSDGLTTAEELALGLAPQNAVSLSPLNDLVLASQYWQDLLTDSLSYVALRALPEVDSDGDGLINKKRMPSPPLMKLTGSEHLKCNMSGLSKISSICLPVTSP